MSQCVAVPAQAICTAPVACERHVREANASAADSPHSSVVGGREPDRLPNYRRADRPKTRRVGGKTENLLRRGRFPPGLLLGEKK